MLISEKERKEIQILENELKKEILKIVMPIIKFIDKILK